jgi:hypothetical protein
MAKVSKRAILEMLLLNELKDLAREFRKDPNGSKVELVDRLMVIPANELLNILWQEELKVICEKLDLPRGKKADMVEGIMNSIDDTFADISHEDEEKIEPTKENIANNLSSTKVPAFNVKEESDAEFLLLNYLGRKYREVNDQFSVGGKLALKVDIDINSGEFGVEVKLASSLLGKSKTTEIFRMIGQAVYYTKLRYKDKFVLAIVGTIDELNDPKLKEAQLFLESLGITSVGVKME